MQYLTHPLLGAAMLLLAFLVCMGVAAIVVVAVLASRRKASKTPVATLYPIPAAERGTGKHLSLGDAVFDHIATEKHRREQEKLRDKLFEMFSDSPPKA